MTSDPNLLRQSSSYAGSDQVYMGNGNALDITRVGNQILPAPSTKLHLNDIYYVSALKENLLSLAKLTKDNNCVFHGASL